jgi:AcrR family transcriptional regulator
VATPSRREHLIDTALALFSEHGFHATGIDTLLVEAGMSKRTLYTYFRSKEDLIVACLRHKDGLMRTQFMANVDKVAGDPEARLLAVYDVAQAWFKQKDFFGCIFINAVGEYAAADSEIRQVSIEYKRLTRDYLLGLCRQLPVAVPEELADALALLLEGAIVTAQVSGKPQSAQTARKMAQTLIDVARRQPAGSKRSR